MKRAFRKPRPSAHDVARAGGSSIMAVLMSLDLGLTQRGSALAGDCPRCGAVGMFSISMAAGSWACLGCEAKGNSGISLLMLAKRLGVSK
jgi:hypothetical protein